MSRTVHCKKLNKTAEGLQAPPLPGPLGQKIYDNISQEAWKMWQQQQTMIINEYRLNMLNPDDRNMLVDAMKKFLFEENNTEHR